MEQKFTNMEQVKPLGVINSVTRSVELLRSLSEGIGRISDLSIRHGLSKSTIHRLLKSLEFSGMVTQDPIKRSYYFSPLIFDLASRPVAHHQNLILCAYDEMRQLRDLTRETVALHIRAGLERICIEELQSPENLKLSSGRGFVSPVYTSSIGKILLSEIDNRELRLLLKNMRLVAVSPNTITDKEVLWKELQKVRRQGYATSFSERVEGAGSISVPIRNYVCPVALSVWGPDNRFTLNVMMKYLEGIVDCARRISNKLVERGERPKGGGVFQRTSQRE